MKLIFIILFFFLSIFCFGSTFNSIQNGDWSNDNTWDGSGTPTSNGDVIHIYHDVIMNYDLFFSFDSLIIHPGGSLVGIYDLIVKAGSYLGIYDYLEVCDLAFSNGSIIYVDVDGSIQVNCDLINNNNYDF